MAESCGFFDAEELVGGGYDREYVAEQWANYFKLFINNGVFVTPTNQLKVQATSGMVVRVLSGWAWINGYWYNNSSNLSITIPANISSGTVKHGIFVRFDGSNRQISIVLGNGRTEVNRTAPYYELKLAEISVAPGTTAIDQSMITDTRANTSVCGFVTGVLDVIDSEDLFDQFTTTFNNWLAEVQAEQEEKSADFDEWMAGEKSDFEDWERTTKSDFEDWETNTKNTYDDWEAFQESEFESWFEAIRGQLSQDAAGALQNQITLIDGTIANIEYTSSASRAYAVGECILYNGAFYTVDAIVAQDDTWDLDINIEPMPKITDSLRAQAAAIAQLVSNISTKADKVQDATSGNFVTLDANGNLVDSGTKPSDFSGKMNVDGSNAASLVSFNSSFKHGDTGVYATGLYSHAEGMAIDFQTYKITSTTPSIIQNLSANSDNRLVLSSHPNDIYTITAEELQSYPTTDTDPNNSYTLLKTFDYDDAYVELRHWYYISTSQAPNEHRLAIYGYKKTALDSALIQYLSSEYTIRASGVASHAEGHGTIASGDISHAEGNSTTAKGDWSHAEGLNSQALSQGSHAEGYDTQANAYYAHAEGGNTIVSNDYAHAEGYYKTASGQGAHAEGYSTSSSYRGVASGKGSHAEGGYTKASNDYAHAEGNYTEASGSKSHAEGLGTKASGEGSHAEGFHSSTTPSIIASGKGAHAEGYASSSSYPTTASGDGSHAGGYSTSGSTTASGKGSFAHGDNCLATGDYSIALGRKARASRAGDFVIGGNSTDLAFSVNPTPVDISSDTTVTTSNGCSGIVRETATLTIDLGSTGNVYILFCMSRTSSSGAIYGSTARLIVTHAQSGTPTNLSLGQTSNAPATISMVSGNKITIKNGAAARITEFHFIRIL